MSIENLNKSLVNTIVKQALIYSQPLTWGVENEDTAIKEYHQLISAEHISTSSYKPILSTSRCFTRPSKRVWMLWRMTRGREVSLQHLQWWSFYFQKIFYLVDTPNSKQLNQKSNYYYQIQGQLAIYDLAYCDFVCWTPVGMLIQRIERDDHFL